MTWDEFCGRYGSDEFEDVMFMNIGEHRYLEFLKSGEIKIHSYKVVFTIAENKTPDQMYQIMLALR